MIITTEKGTIKSDSGMILTDGVTFGTEYKLADDRNVDEFWEISAEEFEKLIGEDDDVEQLASLL